MHKFIDSILKPWFLIALLSTSMTAGLAEPITQSTPTATTENLPQTTSSDKIQVKLPGSTQSTFLTSQISPQVRVLYQDWLDTRRNRNIPVKIYLPSSSSKAKAPYPVIIFSHGLGGSKEAAIYLGDFLAQHGYACFHLQHDGSDEKLWKKTGNEIFSESINKLKGAANGQNLLARTFDVQFAIDQLFLLNKSGPEFKGKLNLKEIAVAGHSFGAGTALVIAGQTFPFPMLNNRLKDNRVKAAIYLSPPSNLRNRTAQEVYGNIRIPGLLFTGTNDNSPIGETPASERRNPYDGIQAPGQYLVIFYNGDHGVFNGRRRRTAQPTDEKFLSMIELTCLKFLDAYLRNDLSAKKWLNSGESAQYFKGTADFEHK